jgi:hypothetical protein
MEYVAVRDLGYHIVLEQRDPVVEIPVGSHLAEVDPLATDDNIHAL